MVVNVDPVRFLGGLRQGSPRRDKASAKTGDKAGGGDRRARHELAATQVRCGQRQGVGASAGTAAHRHAGFAAAFVLLAHDVSPRFRVRFKDFLIGVTVYLSTADSVPEK